MGSLRPLWGAGLGGQVAVEAAAPPSSQEVTLEAR